MQELAQSAVLEQMEGLQAVVDYEWSRASNWHLGGELSLYTRQEDYEPWAHFWEAKRDLARQFIRETDRYRRLRQDGIGQDAAVDQLLDDSAFMDSLKAEKTRLEAGFVALDPRNGHVKAWVGGRNLKVDRYDHVAIAKRQPGSTFKPFVYTAAVDNGYPPTYRLRDSLFTYRDAAGNVWRPRNSGGDISGRWMTLAEGLARSKNTITGQLILEIEPSTAAFYARRMGIQSDLEEVPSLALGTSDVTLLEMTSAYATLANGGLYYDPTVVTRIEDRAGNVLYEATPTPREALSEETAYTVVNMMRNVIDQSYGTGQRIRWQFGLDAYDFAGKTGTTQNSADNWFMLMHPELVTGAWVGFNDQRVTFRSNWWGQGAHTALFLVGDFLRRVDQSDAVQLDASKTFPPASAFGAPEYNPSDAFERDSAERSDDGRVGW
jgi:penicillin-binding protein 1A